jgi:hypothetical protein
MRAAGVLACMRLNRPAHERAGGDVARCLESRHAREATAWRAKVIPF